MTLQQLLFDTNIDQVSLVESCGDVDVSFAKLGGENVALNKIATNTGSMCGGSISNTRIGDTLNRVSVGSAAAFLAKSAFKEHSPYYRTYIDNVLVLVPTYHFLKELRRQLSGEVQLSESNFSPAEEVVCTHYKEWVAGSIKVNEVLLAVVAIDTWLVEELQFLDHHEVTRDYLNTHPWIKLEERV